ncbi:MAG: hypothetical protein P0Y55_11950 [Candidatus Cohnella colombiensis]|uniref:Uncharacterized protein n=1 Tax=Candidatus Cohnella colombiensis TaxID=3121368 RepID=A0AA95F219_9BACL|nr:MAG: hypothetical protein P0Y55_11950 [Cohnella sp.]
MKVTINGRDMTERMFDLEQRENQYFELIKTAAIFVAGALLIVCLPSMFHTIADVFTGFGKDIITAYQSIF